ncbi:MAG: AAA family ATPase [Chromatiaceae bacterium]|jgi:lon-related putative ATP-dependent protease|nr:AAA family ATPase [Chromatiaceae bacterium]
MVSLRPLAPEALYHACDLTAARFATTAELEPLDASLGQERAIEAIGFAVDMPHEGFNLYLMGSTGLGKHALIERILSEHRRGLPAPDDWCYVADFSEPHRPVALHLPPGRGRRLRQDMRQLVEDLLNAIPAAFQSEAYTRRAEAIQEEFKAREEAAAAEIGHKAKEHSIALIHTPTGYTLAPVREGHILGPDEFGNLPEPDKEEIAALIEELRQELQKTLSQVPLWQKEMRRRFKELNQEVTEATVTALIAELQNAYTDLPAVLDYLAAVKRDVVDNAELFRHSDGEEGRAASPDDPHFTRYRVNLLVDNGDLDGAPLIHEDNPTYLNLIGRIEHIARMGTLVTDFTLIKPGALHRANGGFLVLDALRLLTNPFAWDALKRVLRSREIRIESIERLLSLASTISLEPAPIPVDVKIVIIGERLLYYLLRAYDPDFGQFFKVAADFAEDVPRHGDNDLLYARLIAGLQRRHRLLPLTRTAVALTIEQAARRAGDGERLSVHLGSLSDLLREADHRARRERVEVIDRDQIEAAAAARRHRLDHWRERVQEEILRGTLLIDTAGVQLGRVNGLSVVDLGDHAFGTPTRISATARLGNGEVVDIQREVEQGGPIHAKGVFILSAYLGRRYARFQPLCLSASLVFEQTYGMVEGDSASLAELCALLSAIGDLPLRQSLAITGSVNQHGQVQAIGGVNEKVEGFFDICHARGLTGAEGVIIPAANRAHLMLRRDLIDAVAEERFHVWAVDHVDQAMELLTGEPAGVPDAAGIYLADTVNGQIQQRLAQFFAVRQQLSASGRGDN